MPSTLGREEFALWERIDAGMPDYAIGPGKPSIGYRLALAGVVAGLLFVVLAYVGLVAAVAVFVVVEGIRPPLGGTTLEWLRYGSIVSLAPLVLFFLVKPLFVRRKGNEALVRLRPGEHPLLDAYVERIARYADVPMPGAIYVDCSVNASASFDRGFSGLMAKDYRLVLGLPIISGLNLRAFGGVLAHEMGHFAQFHAMRLTYVIRRMNHWLYLVVHDRDRWDEELHDLAFRRRGLLSIVAWPAWLLVSVLRGVLWLVMLVGHGISCFALRQMEFGADRYEIAFAGHEGFSRTTKRISQLGAGFMEARRLLKESWRDGKLAADFAELARVQAEQLSPEAVALAQQLMQKEQGSVFFTHPSDRSRLRKSRHHSWENGVSLFNCPATALFRNFPDLSRRATLAYYRAEFGDRSLESAVVENPAIVKEGRRRRREREAVEQFLGTLWKVLPRLHLVRRDLIEGSKGHTREEIERRWLAERELSEGRILELQESRARHREAVRGYEVLMAGGRVDREKFGTSAGDPWKMHAIIAERRSRFEQSVVELSQFLKSTRERLVVDLQGLIKGDTFLSRETSKLLDAMAFFVEVESDWLEMEFVLTAQRTLVEMLERRKVTADVLQRLNFRAVQSERLRLRILEIARVHADPFAKWDSARTIESLLVQGTSEAEDRGLRAFEEAAGIHEMLWSVYERVLGRLILLASSS